MSLSALRSVGDALDVTREYLMPISVRRIGILAVIVAFLGTAGTPAPANPQFLDPRLWRGFNESPEGTATVSDLDLSVGLVSDAIGALPTWASVLLIVMAALAILYLLVGTLMRFVFVEALTSDRIRVLAPMRDHFGRGLQLIGFRVILWSLLVIPLSAAAAVVAGIGPTWLPSAPVLAGAGGVLAIGLWLIDLITLQFVVPVMIHKRQGIISGWRQFGRTLRDEWIEYVLYAVVRVLIGVAVGILSVIAIAVTLLGIGIVLGTIAGAIVLLGGGIGSIGTVATAFLGGVVLVFTLLAIVTFAVVNVPFQTYLWYYALLVLGDTNPEFDLIPDRRSAARTDNRTPQTAEF